MIRPRVFKSGNAWGVKVDRLIYGRFGTHEAAMHYADLVVRARAVR
jgi:hypothetical protein